MIAVCGNNPEKGIKYRHTWNIVRIGGNYYHLDATFDNTLGNDKKEIRYDYFNLDDKSIFRDHEPLIAPAPKCEEGEHFYYKEKKLSFTKTEDVYRRALQTAKKRKSIYVSLAGRLSDESCFGRTSGADPESRKRKAEECKDQFELAAGGIAI